MIGIGMLGVVCGVGIMFTYNVVASNINATISPQFSVIGEPAQLIIPSIHVDAPIKPVGIDAKGNVGVPSDATHVAWYKYGPRPGMPGAAVMDGHLDTKTVPQAVFYNLDQLKPGGEIDVRTADGKKLVFKVTSVKKYAYDESVKDIFISKSGAPELNLITCTGDWVPEKKIYNERLVVFSELVHS